jgi:hypothetical protein
MTEPGLGARDGFRPGADGDRLRVRLAAQAAEIPRTVLFSGADVAGVSFI